MTRKGFRICALAAAVVSTTTAASSRATLTFNVEPSGWDTAARRDAAVSALTNITARYNAYGDFGNYNIYAYYNAGIPTAQASYLGSIGYGGTYPNDRVTLHESNHYLGSGTYAHTYDGPRAIAMMEQFEGVGARFGTDGTHFWPYGMNYDSEWSEIAAQRNIPLMYALRADWGIGNTANPAAWAATSVTLTASDPLGESGFNYTSTWSDHTFAHPNADYSTGNFTLRTPASGASFNFAGKSLTVNNTNGINGGLLYKGTGNTGVTTFKDLQLSGGYVRHANSSSDVFRLAGKITLSGSPTIDAAQGGISLSATISGSGSFTKTGTFPLALTTGATYAGNTTISAGVLRLAAVSPVASYSFDNLSGSTVTNTGSGGATMNGALAGGAAIVPGGRFGNAVSIPSGASVDINNPILDLHTSGNWTVSAWVKTSTPGATLLSKSNGSTWDYGNTVFYLGDGSGGGSGQIPSSVRWAGGYFQSSPAATPVADNAWHLVTYVNAGDNYSLYIDGVPQPLSSNNARLNVPDIGSVVRLGYTTNTIAADGTVALNGLLDDVRFYNQALSAPQVTSLFQGANVTGSLPPTTNLTIAASATFDVNGATQQLASLTGPANSNISLGAGSLIINSTTPSSFAGNISGASGSLTKSGPSSLTLTGNVSYTGLTTLSGGTLSLSPTASNPILNSPAGVNITAGELLLNYTTTSPLPTVRARLASGLITSSAADPNHSLGYYDNGSTLTITLTLTGDANLDGLLNADDFALLDKGYATSASTWWLGDFNYDGTVTSDDFFLLDRTYASQNTLSPEFLAERAAQFGDHYVSSLLTSIPEPTSLTLLVPSLAALTRRRKNRNNIS